MVRSKKVSAPEEDRIPDSNFNEEGEEIVGSTDNLPQVRYDKGTEPCSNKPQAHSIVARARATKQPVKETAVEIPWTLSMKENDNIEKVRKENVFSEEVTEEEKDIIQQRVALQQRQFAEFEKREKNRKYIKIHGMYDYVSVEEFEEMLKDCSNDEDDVMVRLTKKGFLFNVRKAVAGKYVEEAEEARKSMTVEQLEAYQQLLKKRSATVKKTITDSARKQYRMGGRLALDDALKQVEENGTNGDKAFEGWSEARIRAYQMIEQNPNSYYYRFNAPGEIQRKGQWDAKEREVFFKRLNELGANGQWGIFAMEVPGRVGYQCSNFYRLLVETGEIDDPNYVVDSKGKAHFLFDKKSADGSVSKTFRTHSKHGNGRASSKTKAEVSTEVSTETPTVTAAPPSRSRAAATRRKAAATSTSSDDNAVEKKPVAKKRKRKTRGWNSDDDDEDDFEDYNDNSGTYTSSTRTRTSSRRRTRNTRYNEISDDNDSDDKEYTTSAAIQAEIDIGNPLPGFVDPITLDEVEKPAISKYGHVMGYDSWVRCLTNWEGKKNICPLTKNPLTKRDLVVLTHENIEEYRNKILNF